MQDNEQATVVLADDHNIVREGIAALCASNGMRVLGQVADGPPAIEMIQQLQPDFAIIDLHMPTMTGVEVVRKLRAAGCRAKLMILSISREEATVMEALRAGADAYRAALSHLGRGVLVVHGLQDRVIPLAHARQVAEGLGVAQPRWLDRCGHFPQIEHAEVVNTYLRDFLFAPASR